MSKGKKYTLLIEQEGSTWTAKIVRQVTSKKTTVTKQQGDFKSEDKAQKWGESALSEFTTTLNASNKRHNQQRKETEETKRQRSTRRAEKTEQRNALKQQNRSAIDGSIDGSVNGSTDDSVNNEE